MIRIEAVNLHWLKGAKVQQDLCAHGGFIVWHSGKKVVDQSEGDWTLSASALFLLRTLTSNHLGDDQVAEHLFPCCGFSLFPIKGSKDVEILGCSDGYNIGVEHKDGMVKLHLLNGPAILVTKEEWKKAVCDFSDNVEEFYFSGGKKRPSSDRKGYKVFTKEWKRRRKTKK